MENGTVTVTFFADLGHFQYDIAAAQPRADRQGTEIKTADDQIFTESTKGDSGTAFPEFFNLVIR
jgi:hypothetical protein